VTATPRGRNTHAHASSSRSRSHVLPRAGPAALLLLLAVGLLRAAAPGQVPSRVQLQTEVETQAQTAVGIADLAAEVSTERLVGHVQYLQDSWTRFTSTANAEAVANFLYAHFQQLGFETAYDDFTFDSTFNGQPTPGVRGTNIVATMAGTVAPEWVVIVGAHYDTWPPGGQDPQAYAPGADDNGSGTAAIMEMARVLAGHRFDFTIRVIAFSGEERGRRGSIHYATAAAQRGERILAAINLDMIGFADAAPEDLDLIFDESSEWVARRFAEASARYAPVPVALHLDPTHTRSDHYSFWQAGFDAIHAIEDQPITNTNYHQEADTIATLDLEFFTAATRATLAAAADLAQPSRDPTPPTRVAAESYVVRSAFSRAKLVRVSWRAPEGQSFRGFHVYRSTTSHAGYVRITDTPVSERSLTDQLLPPDQTYYYVVTTVDSSGQESNFSAEGADDATTIQ